MLGIRTLRGQNRVVRVKRADGIGYKVRLIAVTVVFLITIVVVSVVARQLPVQAAPTQLGTPQVTLNPGGGILGNGTDGLRFTVNSVAGGSTPNNAQNGQDGVVYRNTYQYCCSGGGPMLNIGGTLYGQNGPAASSANWTSIEIVSTTGATSTGTRTNSIGNSGATIRYTVVRAGHTYTVDRTVAYTYPNDYITDSYSFVIPAGNSDAVRFYLGGDTAPGSSDSGYGIMLTSPVRSIISLNTFSQIMFGFREVQGSRTFNGATSQNYNAPYATVRAGGDIGFVGTASNHDAGLMMQWNLGSTPGTYTGAFEQFATQQGTNLTAAFAEGYTEPEDPVDLNLSIVNSELDPVAGLGYTLTLPEGLLIDSSATSDCGGTLTANTGTDTITLSGVALGATSNCVVEVPVAAEDPGVYSITAGNVSGLAGALTTNIGNTKLNVGVRTLSFATQGGIGIDDMAVVQGEAATLPSATRAGYTFDGWNTAPDGSGTDYAAGASFTMPSSDTTLYAQWAAIDYTVTFNEQGGDAVSDVTGAHVGDAIEMPDAERDGYTFIEWNAVANGSGTGYDVGDDLTMPAGNVTLYAIWAENFTLTYNSQGGASVASAEYLEDDTVTVPAAPARTDYTFVEWNTQANGEGDFFDPGDTFTMPAGDVTLFAIWEDDDGITMETENAAPNNGDANNDGLLDSQQANVTSFINEVTNKPVTLAVESSGNECFLEDVATVAAGSLASDSAYTYPLGLLDFTVDCGVDGFTAVVKQYFFDAAIDSFTLRKFVNGAFQTVTGASFSTQTIGGRQALVVAYEVTDGGSLDADGIVNGVVVDPAGPGVSAATAGAPNTGVKSAHGLAGLIGVGILGIAVVILGALGLIKTHRSHG